MPTDWADKDGFDALKAQAIAARSYALAYTGWRMGDRHTKSAICTTENCQSIMPARPIILGVGAMRSMRLAENIS